MPHRFWDEAVSTAAYLINRMPTPLLKYSSPYKLLFNCDPDYRFLRTFGCMCYPYLRHYAVTKLDSRSERCVFVGYSAFHHGYRCISMVSGRLYISRDVIFTEDVYPFANASINGIQSTESPHQTQKNPYSLTKETCKGREIERRKKRCSRECLLGEFPLSYSTTTPRPIRCYSSCLEHERENFIQNFISIYLKPTLSFPI